MDPLKFALQNTDVGRWWKRYATNPAHPVTPGPGFLGPPQPFPQPMTGGPPAFLGPPVHPPGPPGPPVFQDPNGPGLPRKLGGGRMFPNPNLYR